MRQSVIALNCFGHVDEVEALVAFVAGPEFSYIHYSAAFSTVASVSSTENLCGRISRPPP
jgi:hypothetical protein